MTKVCLLLFLTLNVKIFLIEMSVATVTFKCERSSIKTNFKSDTKATFETDYSSYAKF